jgi:hypothetical protein
MISISFSDQMTIIFVLVDDWYQAHGKNYLKGKPGRKPEFTERFMQNRNPMLCSKWLIIKAHNGPMMIRLAGMRIFSTSMHPV